MKRPRVLFLAPVEPWCRENGSSVIIADQLEGLFREDVADLLPMFVRPPPEGYQRIVPTGGDGVLLSIPGLPRWRSIVGAALRLGSPLRMRFDNRRVTEAILAELRARTFEPDVVHAEHLPLLDVGAAVARRHRAALVYRAHNIESSLWRRRLGRLPGFLADPIARHMEREEARAIGLADLTLCISEVDLAWARRSTTRSETMPCALLVDRYDRIPSPETRAEQICFVGGLDWGPNEDGLAWFVRDVLPLVRRDVPAATLAVLGRGAAERPWLAGNPAIRIRPPTTSALEVFAASRVSIAPLFQGGGVRIKIPESLVLGCPVVATPVGAEGHDLPGLTRTLDPERFAAACVERLRAPSAPHQRATLRAAVEERHGAGRLARRLGETWARLVGSARRPGA